MLRSNAAKRTVKARGLSSWPGGDGGADYHQPVRSNYRLLSGEAGMRYQEHNGLLWMANPLVLRHGGRITSARIVASQLQYSLFATNRL